METLAPLYQTSGDQVATLPGGARMRLDLSEHVQRWIYFFGVYEEATVGWFRGFVRPGMTVLDVGAHVGQYSLLAASAVGDTGHVHAFEPNPPTFERLSNNVALNGYRNVFTHRVALSDASGEANFFTPADDNLGEATLVEYRSGLPTTVVRCLTLDEWVDDTAIGGRIDLIKIDVQGFEPQVIKGAKRTLDRYRPMIVCEFEERWLRVAGSSTTELKRMLNELRYQPHRITLAGLQPVDEHELHSFENLVLVPVGANGPQAS
jgi:FkbM family methyltransferase